MRDEERRKKEEEEGEEEGRKKNNQIEIFKFVFLNFCVGWLNSWDIFTIV